MFYDSHLAQDANNVELTNCSVGRLSSGRPLPCHYISVHHASSCIARLQIYITVYSYPAAEDLI